MPPFSKGSEGILPAVFWQVFKKQRFGGFAGKVEAAVPGALWPRRACAAQGEGRWLALPQFPLLENDPVSVLLLRNASWSITSPSPSKGSRDLGLSALLKGQHGSVWQPIKGQ